MSPRFAVLGSPVKHSLSPRLFELFAKERGQSLCYQALEVKPSELADTLVSLKAQGYRGVNLTTPLKELAVPLMDELGPAAQIAQSINMVHFRPDGCTWGENSDGAGFLQDLKRQAYSVRGKKILILGAGGAVRGILPNLLAEQPEQIWIANRTLAKAEICAKLSENSNTPIVPISYDEIAALKIDFLIQASSAALSGQAPVLPSDIFNPNALAYDLIYGQPAEPFLTWARGQGVKASDGLGMLIEQAAIAYQCWLGDPPSVIPAKAGIQTALKI